ncbi:Uncharacterized protein PBTT_03693 [Plasmodiophora brassicae]
MNRRRRAQAATPGPVFEGIERFKDITLEKETVSRWATRCQTVLVFALSYSCRRISRIVPQGVKRPEPQAADAEPPAIPVAPPCPLPCRLPTPAIRKPFIVRRALSSAKQHWASMDRSLKTALSAILLLALLNMVAPGTTRVAAELSVVWIALILHDRLSRLIDGNVPVLRQGTAVNVSRGPESRGDVDARIRRHTTQRDTRGRLAVRQGPKGMDAVLEELRTRIPDPIE